jgi:hypothetical protein
VTDKTNAGFQRSVGKRETKCCSVLTNAPEKLVLGISCTKATTVCRDTGKVQGRLVKKISLRDEEEWMPCLSKHSSQREGMAATTPVRNELMSSAQNRDLVLSALHVSDKPPKYIFSFKC